MSKLFRLLGGRWLLFWLLRLLALLEANLLLRSLDISLEFEAERCLHIPPRLTRLHSEWRTTLKYSLQNCFRFSRRCSLQSHEKFTSLKRNRRKRLEIFRTCTEGRMNFSNNSDACRTQLTSSLLGNIRQGLAGSYSLRGGCGEKLNFWSKSFLQQSITCW